MHGTKQSEKAIERLKAFALASPINPGPAGIISHPLWSHVGIVDPTTREIVLLTQENLQEQVEKRCRLLWESCKSIEALLWQVNKPYRLTCLQTFSDLMDDKEYSQALVDCWVSTEWPHQNSTDMLVKMWNRFKKELVEMDSVDKEVLEKLPAMVRVYRGTQTSRAKVRGLSWTLNLEKAEWFASRWGKGGVVYGAVIPKWAIYYYTNERGEQEVVLNPYKLEQIKAVRLHSL